MSSANEDIELLTEKEAAAFLKLSPRTLQSWRYAKKGPQFVEYSSRCKRYRLSVLKEFIAAKTSDTEDKEHE